MWREEVVCQHVWVRDSDFDNFGKILYYSLVTLIFIKTWNYEVLNFNRIKNLFRNLTRNFLDAEKHFSPLNPENGKNSLFSVLEKLSNSSLMNRSGIKNRFQIKNFSLSLRFFPPNFNLIINSKIIHRPSSILSRPLSLSFQASPKA